MTPLDMQPVEKPREVYLRVCQQISETFAGDGFRFFKSRYPRARKCTDRYVCEIGFQTSRYNLSGKYVAATVHAGVDSKEAGQWLDQSDWPFGWTESLGGGQIGNLRKPFRGLIWNFAQP